MARKYGKKASEKVERTMHEFKRGKLKSGSGKKVTSRKQAIAIGLSQARRAGGKVPRAPRDRATMSDDEKVRAYLSNMRPDTEIDSWGMARAVKIEPLAADYALERAQKAGLAVTGDGRWFGPVRSSSRHHAKKKRTSYTSSSYATKKSPAQLDKEIADALSKKPAAERTVHDRLAVMSPSQKKRELKDLERARDDHFRALGYAGNTPEQVRKYHAAIDEINAKMRIFL